MKVQSASKRSYNLPLVVFLILLSLTQAAYCYLICCSIHKKHKEPSCYLSVFLIIFVTNLAILIVYCQITDIQNSVIRPLITDEIQGEIFEDCPVRIHSFEKVNIFIRNF